METTPQNEIQEIEVDWKFLPREYQLNPLKARVDAGKKRLLLVWHRRAGKDLTIWNLVITEAMKVVGAYYYLFPTFAQGKKILWDGRVGPRDGSIRFRDFIPEHLIFDTNETEMQITLVHPNPKDPDVPEPGSIIQIIGTDRMDSIVGTNPIGCVFSEYSLQDPRAWDLLRPILRENGGWAAFVYTPRGRNHGWKLYSRVKDDPSWFVSVLTINDTKKADGTPLVTEADVQQDISEGMDPDVAQQEYYCSWEGSTQGAYFGLHIATARKTNRIGLFPYNSYLPVFTGWDIGVDDETAIWFAQQPRRGIWNFIDFYQNRNLGLDHYAQVLKEKGYNYERHFFPWDMVVKEFGSGKTRLEIAADLGLKPAKAVKKVSIGDKHEAARKLLGSSCFDEKGTDRGIDALVSYTKEFDEKRGTYIDHPLHDWASHPADAYCTFAVGVRDTIGIDRPQTSVSVFDPMKDQTADADFDPRCDAPE